MRGVIKKTHRSGNVTWRYRYAFNGETRERPALSESDASKKYEAACILKAHGLDPDIEMGVSGCSPKSRVPSVADVVDAYMDKLKTRVRSPKGVRAKNFQEIQARRAYSNQEGYARRLKDYFTGSVVTVNLVALRAYVRTRTCGAGTVNHEMDFLRAAFNYHVRANPESAKLIPMISWSDSRLNHTEVPRDRRTSDEEVADLSAKMSEPYRLLPPLAIETILRASEICQLTWEDVRGANIVLPAHKTKGKKKPRLIPLTTRAERILAAIPGPRTGLVFKGPAGKHLYWGLSKEMNAANPEITFHCLRHEAASRFMENGGDIRALMEIGGWASLDMVMKYSHPNLERSRAVMERGAGNVVEFRKAGTE